MNPRAATAIGQLDSIAALVPLLKNVAENIQDTLRDLDRDASRPEAPPRLPDDLVPGFRVVVYKDGGEYYRLDQEKAEAIARWLNSQAILTPEVKAPTDLTDPRD